MGILSLGSYIKFIPYPVVSGFMTGIGVIILITQIPPTLGYDSGKDEQLIEHFMPLGEEQILDRILAEEAEEGNKRKKKTKKEKKEKKERKEKKEKKEKKAKKKEKKKKKKAEL